MAHPVLATGGLRSSAGVVKFLGHVLRRDWAVQLWALSAKRSPSCNTGLLFDALSSRARGMAKRAGIGATVAAAVIFAIVLASSFAVYHAAQDDARLHSTSNAADTLADESAAFDGAGGVNILLKEQAFLESSILDCGSASGAVSIEISSLTDIQTSANLTVVTLAGPTLRGPAADNLSLLAPFGGYAQGFLDTVLHEESKGSESALGVSYLRDETHYANLPVRIGDMAGDCEQALSDIEAVASSTILTNCTASIVLPLIDAAAGGLNTKATASGFNFAVDSTIVGVAPCSVKVTVTVSQANVMGPAGAFRVELQDDALVDFER
jgi:hypothetical protein